MEIDRQEESVMPRPTNHQPPTKAIAMDTDLDALDGIFSEPAAKKARTGIKFQPKAKPRPRKESSAVDVGEDKKLSPQVGPSSVGFKTLKNEKSLKNNEDCAVLNPSLERFVTGESLGSGPCLPSDVSPDINGLHFTMGKSAEISFLDWNLLMIFTLNLPLQWRRLQIGLQLGNDLSTSCPVNNDAEGVLAHSEIPTVHVSETRSVEEEPVIPVISHLNVLAVGVSNASSSYPSPELTIAQDPLTCGDSVSYKSGVPQINARCVELEDAEANPCLETLFELTMQSGLRRGKFKPKAQIDREKPGGTTYRPHGNE